MPPFLHHTSEDLIYETLSSPNTRVMWAAMQLAEAIEYPGERERGFENGENEERNLDSRTRGNPGICGFWMDVGSDH